MKNIFPKNKRVEKQKILHGKDSFRDLQINIAYQMTNKKQNILVISSANKGEGKSFCALQTALAFGENGKRVLLIDMDLHRPKLSKELANNFPGLTSIYFQEKEFDECFVQLNENVQFLPSGLTTINPAEVVNSSRIKELIHSASKSVDIVIIDVPPIRAISDTKAIIEEFKNVLFVVRANKTRKGEIEEAFEKIKMVNPNIMGMVLNMEKISKKERETYLYY